MYTVQDRDVHYKIEMYTTRYRCTLYKIEMYTVQDRDVHYKIEMYTTR